MSSSNQRCMTHSTLINSHPNEYSQQFHHFIFVVKLDRCMGGYNTLNDISNRLFVPNKTEHLYMHR